MANPKARAEAAKLNPIISSVGQSDTLTQCAALIDQLGRFISDSPPDGGAPMYLLTGAISSAINFELESANA